MHTPTNVKLITAPHEYKEVLRPMIERLFRIMDDSLITRGDSDCKPIKPRDEYGQIFKHFVIRCDGDDVDGFYKSSGWVLLTELINEVHPTDALPAGTGRTLDGISYINDPKWTRPIVEKVFKVAQANDELGSITSDDKGVNCLLSVDVCELLQLYQRKKIFRSLIWDLERRSNPVNTKGYIDGKFRRMKTYGFGPFVDDFYAEDYWTMVKDIHYLFEMYGMYVDEISITPDEITILPYSK